MLRRLPPRPFRAVALAVALMATGAGPRGPASPRNLPAIVFVSRNPITGEPGAIPGLGPHHRAAITGGRLLVREPGGRLRELLPPGAFDDVSDPSVSPDAKTIAFAGVGNGEGVLKAWGIWIVGVDGGGLRRITPEPEVVGGRLANGETRLETSNDLDPCWVGPTTIVFASTRYSQRAQYADLPVTNLFVIDVPPSSATGGGALPRRITAERNGAEEPAMDWRTGRIVFARWWFNPFRAAKGSAGITTDPDSAILRDTVNVWQAMELDLDDRRSRLAAADLRTRRGEMGYQPAPLPDGSIAAVFAANLGLSPGPVAVGIHVLSRSLAPERRLAGAIVAASGADGYGAQGLAAPNACSPAALPDGRLLFSYAPGGRGDFGLYVMNADGSRLTRVLDLPGTLELDAAPIVTRPSPPRGRELAGDDFETPEGKPRQVIREQPTFRFHDLDVFADGRAGSPAHGAAQRIADARIRFYRPAALPGPARGDTAILVREAPVAANGEVNESGLPADTPLFEQLVDARGHVLMTAHGPAHVAGSNAGVAGLTTRCIGCHLGHSTLPVPAAASPARGAVGDRP